MFLRNTKLARILVIGAAGCGKSQIINSFLHFAQLWGCKDRVGVFCPTGKVATLLRKYSEAMTWQSKLGYRTSTQKPLTDKKISYLKEYIKNLWIVIFDEVSMIGGNDWNTINTLFKRWSRSKEAYGGKNLIHFGDFNQLPPVFDTSLAVDLKRRDVPAVAREGITLFRKLHQNVFF